MSLRLPMGMLLVAAMAVAGCEAFMTPDVGQAARGRGPAVPANLEAAMSEMERLLTALKADATDPEKIEPTLRNIAMFQRDVAIAKLVTPPQIANMETAEEKTKATSSYRSMMNGLTRTLLDLEDAVLAKKPDDIKKALTKLQEIEKQGHAELKVAH